MIQNRANRGESKPLRFRNPQCTNEQQWVCAGDKMKKLRSEIEKVKREIERLKKRRRKNVF